MDNKPLNKCHGGGDDGGYADIKQSARIMPGGPGKRLLKEVLFEVEQEMNGGKCLLRAKACGGKEPGMPKDLTGI